MRKLLENHGFLLSWDEMIDNEENNKLEEI
jgi:hypothetical protein